MDDVTAEELDRELQVAARPAEDSLQRVRDRLRLRLEDDDPSRSGPLQVVRTGSRAPFWLMTAAAAAAFLLVGAAGAVLVVPRTAGQGVSSMVFPPQPAGQSTGQSADFGSARGPGGYGAGGGAYSGGGVLCGGAPGIQVNGRALAATGIGQVAPTPSEAGANVSFSLQETGGDPAAASAALQSRLTGLMSVLEANGVPRGDARVTNFNISSTGPKDPSGRGGGFMASASVQALVPAEQVAKVSAEALKAPGVTGYWTSPALIGAPNPQAVQGAIAAATAQAKEVASSTANAAGVQLGPVQNVVTVPPTICGYGPKGPERAVQVTITYALK
jgi:uncharacterized protein YggE